MHVSQRLPRLKVRNRARHDVQKGELEEQHRVTERRFLPYCVGCLPSQVDLFRDGQCVVHFNPKIADGTLELRVP